MITIRKLAAMFGLSRTAVLYYDRIGLLQPTSRTKAGYRLYDDDAVKRLRQISAYKNAGLSLGEIGELLDMPEASDNGVFRRRLSELDQQVAELRVQQRAILDLMRKAGDADPGTAMEKEDWVEILRASGMDEADMRRWHEAFERNAPEAHHSFLRWLGIDEEEAIEIRKGSHNTHK